MKRKKKISLLAALVVAVLSFGAGSRYQTYQNDRWFENAIADIRAEDMMKYKAQLRCL